MLLNEVNNLRNTVWYCIRYVLLIGYNLLCKAHIIKFLTLFLNNYFTKIKFSLPFLCSPFLNVLSLQLIFCLDKNSISLLRHIWILLSQTKAIHIVQLQNCIKSRVDALFKRFLYFYLILFLPPVSNLKLVQWNIFFEFNSWTSIISRKIKVVWKVLIKLVLLMFYCCD